MRDGVDAAWVDDPAFEVAVISLALLAAFDLGGISRDADQIPSEPRNETGVAVAADDDGEGEGSEVDVVDTPGVEAALIT